MYIEIPGKPIPQPRLRLFYRYGKSIVFDPSTKQKKLVKKIIKDQVDLVKLTQFQYPVVNFLFYMPIPVKLRKAAKCSKRALRHILKPDVDNLIKFYLDCMNGLVYEDDKTVAIGQAYKICSDSPRTVIQIRESDLMIKPECIACGF